MVIHYKIILVFVFFLFSSLVFAHTVTLEDKSIEKIVNERMALMQKIKNSSSKIYRLIASNEFEEINELNKILLHSAMEFRNYYPEGSQHKDASDMIWTDRDTFNEYNDKFVNDIEMIALSVELEDAEMLSDSFKEMAANCGSCHKKFRN
tara:strand:- start:208 stop:657 length:450 start_codon:yes stop_codon:yes gene_type:complete